MSPILSTLLFAAAATAEFTTSMWLPSSPYRDEEPLGFEGSVVGVDGDRVTLALAPTSTSKYRYSTDSETITLIGSEAFENVVTTSIQRSGEYTVSYGCTLGSDQRPVCAYSSNGPAAWSMWCSDDYRHGTDISTSTRRITYESPYTVVTQYETYDYYEDTPDFCTEGGSTIPASYAVVTETASEASIQTYQIIITAGEEKLSATAGATPTSSGASATTTSTGVTPAPTSSGNFTSGAPIPEQTGNVAPMVTLAPALAGLGAFVAAMVL